MSTASLATSMENLNGRLGHLTQSKKKFSPNSKKSSQKKATTSPQNTTTISSSVSFEPIWRQEYGTNDIRDTFDFPEYPVVKKFYPRYYHKVDKIGRPLYVERFGVLDLTQLFSVTTDERMLRNHVARLQYKVWTAFGTELCDYGFEGVSVSMFSSVFGLVKQVSNIAQNYYPEMLGKMFIINAPLDPCQTLLDEVTVNKIYILGSGYKEKLLEFIDVDCLPEALGGSCNCPGGCDMADIGPWNDGSVEGYPREEFERFEVKYGTGDMMRHVKHAEANGGRRHDFLGEGLGKDDWRVCGVMSICGLPLLTLSLPKLQFLFYPCLHACLEASIRDAEK
ncbi:CRAL-TRIO domain-containing protein [Chytridium lagenaria]|nr:CRAL-TRIO domain-containing protein [Chytridium lagenaria]